MITAIMIYLYFIVQGKIEWMIWNKQYKCRYFDYHALRAMEHLVIFIGLLAHDLSWVGIVGHAAIANLIYEMILKGSWDIRTDRKTFNIFNYDIPYRWWLYYVGMGFGIIILLWS